MMPARSYCDCRRTSIALVGVVPVLMALHNTPIRLAEDRRSTRARRRREKMFPPHVNVNSVFIHENGNSGSQCAWRGAWHST